MQLGLTIPLQRRLNIKGLSHGGLLDRRFCWDLHGITLHGRTCLLAVHCSSRYAFSLFDLALSDRNVLPETFLLGLRRSLSAAGIPEAQIAAFLRQTGAPELTKTHGRREVAFLNRAWDDVLALDYAVDRSTREQPLLDRAVNTVRCRCAGQNDGGTPLERLCRELGAIG